MCVPQLPIIAHLRDLTYQHIQAQQPEVSAALDGWQSDDEPSRDRNSLAADPSGAISRASTLWSPLPNRSLAILHQHHRSILGHVRSSVFLCSALHCTHHPAAQSTANSQAASLCLQGARLLLAQGLLEGVQGHALQSRVVEA